MFGPLTIADVLNRPLFHETVVATGESGLNRYVTWVHILDVPEARHFIRGGELVLTTGLGFVQRENGFYKYVQELIEEGAAGLCIELGTAVTDLPESVLQLAHRHSFPLILFPVQVHFVDITQDVHRLILGRHHKFIDDLEDLSRKLQQLTVAAMGTHQMLQLVHETTGYPILYHRNGAKAMVIHNQFDKKPELLAEWSAHFRFESEPIIEPQMMDIPSTCTQMRELGNVIVAQSTVVLGLSRGTFAFIVSRHDVDDYLLLMAYKVTNALALDEFRRLSVEERQLFSEQDWVERIAHEEVISPPSFLESSRARHKRYCVVVITCPQHIGTLSEGSEDRRNEPVDETDWLNRKADLSMIARLAFTKEGFRPYLSVRPDIIIAVLEWEHSTTSIKSKIGASVQQLKQAFIRSGFRPHIGVGVGHEVSLSGLGSSYKTAIAAWTIRGKAFQQDVLFYEESGIYRWIQLLHTEERAHELAKIDIYRVHEYDAKHHADLFRTLKVYLDCDRSKQKTAEQLFIHRQTLYHRLKLLDQLLQVDLEDPAQRLALHVSVYFALYETSF